jgi:Prp8 binding protein
MDPSPTPKRRKGGNGEVLNDTVDDNGVMVVVANGPSMKVPTTAKTTPNPTRLGATSSLPCPTLQLTGHTGSVYAVQYSPSGATLCSTSFDMTCLLWRHRPMEYDNDDDDENGSSGWVHRADASAVATYENLLVLRGHKNAVLDCDWCDNTTIVTASADQTLMLWDAPTGHRLRKWTSHTGIVNAVTVMEEHNLIASASDDTTILLWDRRNKHPVGTYSTEYPVLAVAACAGSTSGGGATLSSNHQLFTGGIDPQIRVWDIRQASAPLDRFSGHTDTVTCLSVHPDGTHLLSNSMDQTLRQWDIRPFVQPSPPPNYGDMMMMGGHTHPHHHHHHHERLTQTYTGHQHSAEKGLLKCAWSVDGTLVSAGSSDARVHIWDVQSGQELYDLPGHTGCVHAVTFHPTETTVLASGSSDQHVFVGELS